jgi:hypothetical protein
MTVPWDWIVHLVRTNQDLRKQLDEHRCTEPADQAELLPIPEALDGAPHREKRFVAALLPQFDARIWDWAKLLFQGYQEAADVLTPLESDTWTADVVLQAANLGKRKKREVKPKSPVSTMMDWLQLPLFRNQTLLKPEPSVSTMMHWLQLPLFRNQTLLTIAEVNHTISEPQQRNSTEEPRRPPGQVHRYSLEDVFDFCIVALVFVFAMMVAFAAGQAGKKAQREEEVLPIAVIRRLESESWNDDDIIQDCENCDFHLEAGVRIMERRRYHSRL